MSGITRSYVGLGANVGDARKTLEDAVGALAGIPGANLAGVSRLYMTRPVGVTDQPDFLNAVIALDVASGARADEGATRLLVKLKDLERAFGRRAREHWGPRELDLDLLLFGDARLSIDRPAGGAPLTAERDPAAATRLLEVPHPGMRRRLFVLAPLADLAPDLVPPGWDVTVERARLQQSLLEGEDAVRAVGTWDPAAAGWFTAGGAASG